MTENVWQWSDDARARLMREDKERREQEQQAAPAPMGDWKWSDDARARLMKTER